MSSCVCLPSLRDQVPIYSSVQLMKTRPDELALVYFITLMYCRGQSSTVGRDTGWPVEPYFLVNKLNNPGSNTEENCSQVGLFHLQSPNIDDLLERLLRRLWNPHSWKILRAV